MFTAYFRIHAVSKGTLLINLKEILMELGTNIFVHLVQLHELFFFNMMNMFWVVLL